MFSTLHTLTTSSRALASTVMQDSSVTVDVFYVYYCVSTPGATCMQHIHIYIYIYNRTADNTQSCAAACIQPFLIAWLDQELYIHNIAHSFV